MNKKFTMVCASLLLASAFSVNAASVYTPDVKLVEYATAPSGTQIKAINLADGVKFYLKKNNSSYLTVSTVKVGETEFTSFVTSQSDFKNASIFEVRNLETVTGGVVFELYVDGKKLSVSSVSGSTVTDKDKVVSKFFSTDKTTDISNIVTYVVNGIGKNLCAYTSSIVAYTTELDYKATDLKEFNATSTTFSFDFSDDELVGNEFKSVIPVTLSADNTAKQGTYFVRGSKAKDFNPADAKTYKDVEILAINPNSRYGLNSTIAQEGYSLYWMKAENALKDGAIVADSTSIAAFTSILEKDQLNNEGVVELSIKPNVTKTSGQVFSGTELKVAAIKTSATDTKAYVTTVAPTTNWSVVKNAQLGDNTYLAASEFLKADAINTVSILVVNGTPGAGKYYNYVISTGTTETYMPASKLDFSMAQNQWVVTDFDGKYTVTLKNRLTDQVLTLRVAKTEAGYEVKSGLDQVATVDGNVNAVVKFLPIETTQNDGYLALTEDQMKNGIKLSFTGETVLAGEKEFFGVYNEAKSSMTLDLDSENAIIFYAVKNLTDDKKADKVTKPDFTYACLNAEGEVTYKTAEANLVIPTYILATELDKDGKVVKSLGSGYSISQSSTPNTVFAFAKNMNGGYSLVSHYPNTTSLETYAAQPVAGVQYNKVTGTNPDGLTFTSVSRYDADAVNNVFANLNVLSNVELNTSLPAVSGHYTFDNARGSINVKDLVGINEGFLASEGQVFWLDTADIENEHPSFYISFGNDSVAARNYMFNPIDSAKVFDEFTAKYKYNDVYYYGEDAMVDELTNEAKGTLKAAFASAVAEEGKDLADAFKFTITLKDEAVADEYVVRSVKNTDLYVGQKNGVVILTDKDNAMAFTVNPAEAPTSNESVVASEVKVVANNGSVVVKNAAGKNVVVSTILGQVVANEVLTSDNATINVPAGIVVVAVDGESFKVSVK